MSRGVDLAARLTAGCVWGLIALVYMVVSVAVVLGPFWLLWWLSP